MKRFVLLSSLLFACGAAPQTDAAPAVSIATPSATPAKLTINGAAPKKDELARLESNLGVKAEPGDWWYDKTSGLAGRLGRHPEFFIGPGYDFGELAADASAGTSGFFYNGRQLTMVEATLIGTLLGITPEQFQYVTLKRYKLLHTGDVYSEDGSVWFVNLNELTKQRGSKKSSGAWCKETSSINGPACGGVDSSGCTSVTIPSSTPSPSGVANTIDVASCR